VREDEKMSTFIALDDIRVATPCNALWDNMRGDDTARFCQTCGKNVYSLSKMSRAEAEALIREKEGKLCARFYRRADGTLLTDNCPVGLRAARRQLKWLGAGVAALAASGVAIFGGGAGKSETVVPARAPLPFSTLREVQPIKMVMDWLSPQPTPQPMIMGMIVPPPRTPAPPSGTQPSSE
jgi:hypothetical protein